MKLTLLIGSVFAAAFCMGVVPASASIHTVSTDEIFDFSGLCTDCEGTVEAELVLKDYTPGEKINRRDFVSFTYYGSNLVDEFEITKWSRGLHISGRLPDDLPGPAHISISDRYYSFTSYKDGDWQVDTKSHGISDFGTQGAYNAVPEPSTWAMFVLGFAGLGFAGYRRLERPLQPRRNASRFSVATDNAVHFGRRFCFAWLPVLRSFHRVAARQSWRSVGHEPFHRASASDRLRASGGRCASVSVARITGRRRC